MSVGNIYGYFENKDALVCAIGGFADAGHARRPAPKKTGMGFVFDILSLVRALKKLSMISCSRSIFPLPNNIKFTIIDCTAYTS